MSRAGTIERSFDERLRELETEQIPRYTEAARDDDPAATALLAAMMRERDETREALRRSRALASEPWDEVRIEVGDTVELVEDGTGEAERYVLVWETGSRLVDGWISHRSPLGGALIGRRRGESVAVDTPGGTIIVRIADFERS